MTEYAVLSGTVNKLLQIDMTFILHARAF